MHGYRIHDSLLERPQVKPLRYHGPIYFCNPVFLLQSGANIEAEKRVVVRYTSGGARRVPPVESTLVAC